MESAAVGRLGWIHIAGRVAIAGAILGMVGDGALLYAPTGGYMEGDYAFLRDIPTTRLLWGHYLGILAIPFEAAGLYLVWLGLLPRGKKVALGAVAVGLYLLFLGVAYHGGVYPLAAAARMDALLPFSEPLGLGFAGAFFVSVSAFTWAILRGKTAYPRWVAVASPLVSYAGIMGLYFAVPSLGNLLAPMGFNLSMAILYAVLMMSGRKWVQAGKAQ